MPSAPKDPKPDAAGCAERKMFRAADFFSSLLGVSRGGRYFFSTGCGWHLDGLLSIEGSLPEVDGGEPRLMYLPHFGYGGIEVVSFSDFADYQRKRHRNSSGRSATQKSL